MNVNVPRINPNDDEVKIVEIRFRNGAQVAKGDVIAVVETNKAALEVTSEHSGYIRYRYKAGDMAPVQSVLATFSQDSKAQDKILATPASNDDGRVTKKAKQLLEEHNLDISSFPASGMITEKTVLGYLQQKTGDKPASPSQTPPLSRTKLTAIENMRLSRRSAVEAHMLAHGPSLKVLNIKPDNFTDALLYATAIAVKKHEGLLTGLDDKNNTYKHSSALGYILENGDDLFVQSIPLERCTCTADIGKFRIGKSMEIMRASGKFANEPAPVIVSLINSASVDFHVPVLFPGANLMLGTAVSPDNPEKPLRIAFVYDHRHIYGNKIARFADDVMAALTQIGEAG